MKVYKFGGASIANPQRMSALLPIIKAVKTPLVIVISAYGKTTNALEEIVQAALSGQKDLAYTRIRQLGEAHQNYVCELLSDRFQEACLRNLSVFIDQLQQIAGMTKGRNPDAVYDQIVSKGELLSSTILTYFLKEHSLPAYWLDVRKIIQTDNRHKRAEVNLEETAHRVEQHINPLLHQGKLVVTQGFIGATDYGVPTTLGREGSDYTGALLSSMLKAESLTIWKDVEGLLTADPRLFPEAQQIPETTYYEAIEMAFYGAQVIHPKTIKPLQNSDIPLLIKCFLKPEAAGTLIHNTDQQMAYPPMIVLKKNQSLLQITSRDFSFITEGNLSRIYRIFHEFGIRINLTQNAAISVVFSVNNDSRRLPELIKELRKEYSVLKNENQSLLTVRHFQEPFLKDLIKDKTILLTQKTRSTIQVVLDWD